MNRAMRRANARAGRKVHGHGGGSCAVCGMSYQTQEGRLISRLAGFCPDCGGLLAAADVEDDGERFSVEAICTRCDGWHAFGGAVSGLGGVVPWWRE